MAAALFSPGPDRVLAAEKADAPGRQITAEPAPAQTSIPLASAVPADALLFIAAAGRPDWQKALDGSAIGRAYRQEEVRAFVKPVLEKINEFFSKNKIRVEKNFGNALSFREIENALQGRLGVAVTGMQAAAPLPEDGPAGEAGKAGEKPVLLFVAEVGRNDAAFENAIGEFVRRVQDIVRAGGGRAELSARSYRGADLRVFRLDRHTIAYARDKGCFLMAFDLETVEKAIDCLEGRAPSLNSIEAVAPAENGLLRISVNAGRLVREKRRKEPDGKIWKQLDILGLSAVKRAEYRLGFSGPAFRETLSLSFDRNAGLIALLSKAAPVDARKLAADVPGRAMTFMAARLPAPELLPGIMQMLEKTGGPAKTDLERKFAELKAAGLDAAKLLSDSLSGEVAFYALPRAGALLPDAVAVFQLRSEDGVINSLTVLADILLHRYVVRAATRFKQNGETRVDAVKVNQLIARHSPRVADYNGGKLLYFPLDNDDRRAVPAAVLTGRKLILATSPAAAKLAAGIPGEGESLADRKDFVRSLGLMPPGPQGVHYLDSAASFKLLYALIVPHLAGNRSLQERWGIDTGKLPPAGKISPHLISEAAGLYARPGKLRLETISNVPRGAIIAAALLLKTPGAAGAEPKRSTGENPRPLPAKKEEF